MANQDARQDRNQFPALTAHTGTAGTAEVVRVVATEAGALSVDIVSGDTINVGTLTLGTIGMVHAGTVDSPKYQLILDGTTTANVKYVGEAAIGSATSAACWRIKKLDKTTSNVLIIKWAGTTSTFSQVWDNRGTLSYA